MQLAFTGRRPCHTRHSHVYLDLERHHMSTHSTCTSTKQKTHHVPLANK